MMTNQPLPITPLGLTPNGGQPSEVEDAAVGASEVARGLVGGIEMAAAAVSLASPAEGARRALDPTAVLIGGAGWAAAWFGLGRLPVLPRFTGAAVVGGLVLSAHRRSVLQAAVSGLPVEE